MRILRDIADLVHAVVSPLVRPALLGLPLLLVLLVARNLKRRIEDEPEMDP